MIHSRGVNISPGKSDLKKCPEKITKWNSSFAVFFIEEWKKTQKEFTELRNKFLFVLF